VYEITPEGERALSLWLHTAEPMPFEVRDLATLKLFFADALPPSEALALVHAIRLRSEQTLARFERQSAPPARTADAGGAHYPLLSPARDRRPPSAGRCVRRPRARALRPTTPVASARRL
jgi:hypothetical protein